MSVPLTNNEPVENDAVPADHWLHKIKPIMLKTIIISITVIGVIAGILAMLGSGGSVYLQLFQTVSVITIASSMVIVDASLVVRKNSPVKILFGLLTSVLWLTIGIYKIWVQPLIEEATVLSGTPVNYDSFFSTYGMFITNVFTLAVLFGLFRLYVFVLQLMINLIKDSKIGFVKSIAKFVTIPLMTFATILLLLPLSITLSIVTFGDGYWRLTTGGIILAFVGFFSVFLSSKFFDEKKPARVKPYSQPYYQDQYGMQQPVPSNPTPGYYFEQNPSVYPQNPNYGQPQNPYGQPYPQHQAPQPPAASPAAYNAEQPAPPVYPVPQPPAAPQGAPTAPPPPVIPDVIPNKYSTPPAS